MEIFFIFFQLLPFSASTLFDPLITTQQLGNLSSYSSPFVLDPSSPSALMLSSYAQLAPTMVKIKIETEL